MSMKKFAITDIGRVRESNQDQAFVYTNNNMDSIGIVCDGMGGHKAGEYASLLVAKTILDQFIEVDPFQNEEQASLWLNDTILYANDLVKEKSQSDEKFSGMGTTLCIALVSQQFILIANVGDSRAYVLQDDIFKLVTEDQTLVNILLKKKQISEEEALAHPNKHVLMYAVGTMEAPQIDIYSIQRNACTIMLCSDGIYNLVSTSYLKTILEGSLPISQKAITIVNEANTNGGYDNMSIVLMEVNANE